MAIFVGLNTAPKRTYMMFFKLKMTNYLKMLWIILVGCLISCSDSEKPEDEDIYLFSYFMNNGEDGLHLAYSKDGLKWTPLNDNKTFLKPEAGRDKLMRDPCIIKGGDGKFHMVWTVSWNERGIGYANSEDLVNWSEQKYLPVMEHEPDARNCWAPELYYDDQEDSYVIYWATTIPGRFPETDSLGDDGYNHRMYYTTTRDFEQFSETALLYDRGFNVIDAVIKPTEEKYIMFLKDETLLPKPQKNIRIATSTELLSDYSPAGEPISGDWVEGPTVVQADSGWIVYFDRYTQHRMGAVYSPDLTNWKDISDKLSFPEGARHGTIFKASATLLERLKKIDK